MPFLHGFRRIVFEYQPLVDAILVTVGLEEGASRDEERYVLTAHYTSLTLLSVSVFISMSFRYKCIHFFLLSFQSFEMLFSATALFEVRF